MGGAAHADDIRIEHKIPASAPVATVLVAQCNHAIGLYATMADGTLLAFDMTSGVAFAELVKWGEKARRSITVETKCVVSEGDASAT